MANYYYDVTVTAPIPHGSDILNKPCTVVFSYPDGSHSHTYNAILFAWLNATIVRIQSQVMNMEAAAQGMNGGTLTITTPRGQVICGIAAFAGPLLEEAVLGASSLITAGSGPSPIFGVVLNLNGTPVPIVADSLANIKENGFNFTLPQPVYLGTPNDFIAWIDSTFGTDLKTILNPADLPGPIKDVVEKLMGVAITIEVAIVDVPGTASPAGTPTTYKLVISAVFPGAGVPLIPGVLSLQGGTAGVISNPAPPAVA